MTEKQLKELLVENKSNLQSNDLYSVYVDASLKYGKTTSEPELTKFLLSRNISPLKYFTSQIPSCCFYGIEENFVKALNIKEGITDIDDWAFRNCSTLEKVVLPSTLQHLGHRAFQGCENLKEVYFKSSSLVSVGSRLFYECEKLSDIYVSWPQDDDFDEEMIESFNANKNVTIHYNS